VNPFQYEGGPFDLRITRIDDKVTLSLYRGDKIIVEMDMPRKGAAELANKIIASLF
jgi:hypothetical protein